jgi:hypothetical protein
LPEGYRHTFCAGAETFNNGDATGAGQRPFHDLGPDEGRIVFDLGQVVRVHLRPSRQRLARPAPRQLGVDVAKRLARAQPEQARQIGIVSLGRQAEAPA